MTRCTLEHNHRLSGPLRAGRQDPVLPEELLAEHVSALKEWARIPVAVRTQVGIYWTVPPLCIRLVTTEYDRQVSSTGFDIFFVLDKAVEIKIKRT